MYLVMLWCDVDDDYHFACLCKNNYHIVLSVGVNVKYLLLFS